MRKAGLLGLTLAALCAAYVAGVPNPMGEGRY